MGTLGGYCALALACSVSLSAATISGTVRITKPLTRKKVSLSQVYERAAVAATPEQRTAALPAEYERVAIYLEGGLTASKPVTAEVIQRQRRFDPELVIVSPGSKVLFPNTDPIFHNVFSLSKAKQFDLGNYPKGQSRAVHFDKPGIVLVHCHLHPNMNAAVVVAPGPFYARPDEQGNYTIGDVPAGSYTLVAWHKSAGFFRRKIEVKDATPLAVDLEIPLKEGFAP